MSTLTKQSPAVEPSASSEAPAKEARERVEPVPERPLFMNGYPSLVPGDIGANPLHDIRLTIRDIRRRWQQYRLGR